MHTHQKKLKYLFQILLHTASRTNWIYYNNYGFTNDEWKYYYYEDLPQDNEGK